MVMLKSTLAYIKLKGRMITLQSKLQQFLHLEKPSASTPEEHQAAKFRQVLIDEQMTVSAKILFNQTLGLAVGLWSPIVLLVVSMMPTFLLFAFHVIEQLIRTQIQMLKAKSQFDDIEAAEVQELHHQVAELQGIILELQALVPADAVLDNHLKSRIRDLQLDDDQIMDPRSPHPLINKSESDDPQSEMLSQVLIHGRFVSQILVPLPNTRMKSCSATLVWLSVLLVLIDFGLGLGPWVAWGLLTVAHGAILFYRRKQSSDSPKDAVQDDANTDESVVFSAQSSGMNINKNPIAVTLSCRDLTLSIDQRPHNRPPVNDKESIGVCQMQSHDPSNGKSWFQNTRGSQAEQNEAPIRKKKKKVSKAAKLAEAKAVMEENHTGQRALLVEGSNNSRLSDDPEQQLKVGAAISATSITPIGALSKQEGKARLAVLRSQRESGGISEADYTDQKRLVMQLVDQLKTGDDDRLVDDAVEQELIMI